MCDAQAVTVTYAAVTAFLYYLCSAHLIHIVGVNVIGSLNPTHLVEGKNNSWIDICQHCQAICAHGRWTTALLGYLINIKGCFSSVHKSIVSSREGWLFIYEKNSIKGLLSPVYLSDQLPAVNEPSKHSPVFLRPSHLGGQQSSTCLPLSLWTTLLALHKRIRCVGQSNITTASTPPPSCICMLPPLISTSFRQLFSCNRQLHEQWLAFRSARSDAEREFRDVHIPQRYYIGMLLEHHLGNSMWTGKRTACWCRCSIWEWCSSSGQLRKEA